MELLKYKDRLLNFLENYIPSLYSKIYYKDSDTAVIKIHDSEVRLNLDTLTLEVEGPLSKVAIASARRSGVTFGHWSRKTLMAYIKTDKGLQGQDGNKDRVLNVYFLIIAYIF